MKSDQQTFARRMTAYLVAAAVALSPLALVPATAHADDAREQAKGHFLEGRRLFAAGDYRAAIREFEAADRLAPSPLLSFNIGLAHDQLGERQEALRRYKAYLAQVPNAPNRDRVQAKINRIEGELRAEAVTAAEAARPAPTPSPTVTPDPAVTPAPAPDPAVEPTATDPAVSTSATEPGVAEPAVEPRVAPRVAPAVSAAPPQYAPTGDPAIDRVAGIDIAAIRDQRAGAMGAPPETASAGAPDGGTSDRSAHENFGADDPTKKKSKPAYKQWWFWVVVGVSAVILYDIVATDSSNADAVAGPTLFRF
jgi:iron complex outermembrane receptor protein